MANWLNADGLLVKLGLTEATVNPGGEYEFDGNIHYSEFDILGASVPSSLTILSDNVVLPKGARIHSVSLYVETAFASGGSATLDVGLINASDRSTTVAATGLVAGAAVASLTAGASIAGAGATVGTNIATTPGVLVAVKYNTAAFTAGKGKLRVNWYMP